MIQRNPLLKSITTVFLFWYVILFIPAWLFGAHVFQLPQYLLYAVAIMVSGAMLGFFVFLGLQNLLSRATEQTITAGARFREVRVMLGVMPPLPEPARKALPAGTLTALPWWSALQANFPAHAKAVRAVLEVMNTRPELPASPVPGGHGGRTLVEHSMAVSREIISQAKAWVYEGQKDRRGKVRVALQGDPHRFGREDIGLLILTGLAHDIGKLTCYQDAGRDSEGRPLVREVQPNHDTAGARLLRTLPEVMALPYEDRMAMLLAIGYYHHPYALPRADWITDRMRSLTELLIHADVETGKKEGHTLTNDYDLEDPEDADDDAPRVPVEIPMDDDDDSFFGAAALPQCPDPMPAPKQAPATTPAPRTAQVAPSIGTEQLPYELDTFLRLVRKDGAINGRNQAKRIAWKVADRVYVMEPVLRRQVAAYGGLPPSAIAEDLSENNGNAAPFTVKLLEQLAGRKALVTTFDGQDYAPARAIFVSVSPKGGEMAVFIVKTEKVPGASSIPDAKPMVIRRPLWGEKKPATQQHALGSPVEDADDDLFGSQADAQESPTPPAPASQVGSRHASAGADDDDLPFSLAEMPIAHAQSVEDSGDQNDKEAPASSEPICVTHTDSHPSADQAALPLPTNTEALRDALPEALTQLLLSDAWHWPVETIEKDGGELIVVDLESEAGAAITSVLQSYQSHGVPVDRVRIVTRKATQKRAYVWPKSAGIAPLTGTASTEA